MYADVRRRLVFLDKPVVAARVAGLVQYDVATGQLEPVKGAQADDVVADATSDGQTGLRAGRAGWYIWTWGWCEGAAGAADQPHPDPSAVTRAPDALQRAAVQC
jgi:hypothetical protein